MPPSLWSFLLFHGYRIADETIVIESNKLTEDPNKINFYKLKYELKQRETETSDLKIDELSVANDIYMLAFAA